MLQLPFSNSKQVSSMASLQSPILAVELAATTEQRQRFLQSLHYLGPALVLAYFLVSTSISACTLQNLKACGTGPRRLLVSLLSLVVASFLAESCMLLTDTAVNHARHSSTDTNVSACPWVCSFGRQRFHISFADRKLIRCMHYSHCLSGQLLLSVL